MAQRPALFRTFEANRPASVIIDARPFHKWALFARLSDGMKSEIEIFVRRESPPLPHERISNWESDHVFKSTGHGLNNGRGGRFPGPTNESDNISDRSARVPGGFREQRNSRKDAGRNDNSSQTVDSYPAQCNRRATKCGVLWGNCSVSS